MNPSNQHQEQRVTLKGLIKDAGTTQRELSERTGIAEVTFNTWVARKKIPRLDKAVVVARELGVSLKTFAESIGLNVENLPGDTTEEE